MRRMGTIGGRVAGFGLVLALGLASIPASAFAQSERPWLGVVTQSLDDGLRDGMDYRGSGVLVSRVVEGQAADRAGIRKGDVIVSVDGRSIDSPEELSRVIRGSRVGQTVSVVVVRDGTRRTLGARLRSRGDEAWMDAERDLDRELRGEIDRDVRRDIDRDLRREIDRDVREKVERDVRRDIDRDVRRKVERDVHRDHERHLEDMRDLPRFFNFNSSGRGRLGVRLEDLSGDLGSYFDSSEGGALVLEVMKDTPAERAGLKSGDVIVRIQDRKISNSEDVVDAVRRAPRGRLPVTVLRKGERRTFEPEIEDGPMTWRGSEGRDFTMLAPRGDRRFMVRGRDPVAPPAPRDPQATRDELQQLREEIRQLREKLDRLENR